MFKYITLFILLCFSVQGQEAVVKKNERYYQLLSAAHLKGETEVVLEDKTRVDVLTDKVAYEVDWASKWAEGIGQSLHYSAMTGKHAGLILIVKQKEDYRHVVKVTNIILVKSLNIVLYVYDVEKGTLIKVNE